MITENYDSMLTARLPLRHSLDLVGIEGKEMADELARGGSNLERELVDESANLPIKAVRTLIDKAAIGITKQVWHNMDSCVWTEPQP